MPKTKVQKQDIVAEIADKLGKASSVVFTDYQGLTMSELSELRNKLAESSAELTVTKNNLLRVALQTTSYQLPATVYEGPIATLFAFGDEITPIKTLTKGLKDYQKGSVKGGILAGEFLDGLMIGKLAALPSKDELRAKVVGSLSAPLYGIVGVLQANLRNLVYALSEIQKQRGGV